ncbi:MAG: hypothetical protein HOV81_41980 [Kofleriaceae bacterium]|nr:hypothetical protein [Kofleriaceae bacterium]
MKTAFLILGLVFAAACDDNDSSDTSGPGTGSDDPENFTAFVIDMIEQHTDAVSAPIAFGVFAELPDDDTNNVHAYDSLF